MVFVRVVFVDDGLGKCFVLVVFFIFFEKDGFFVIVWWGGEKGFLYRYWFLLREVFCLVQFFRIFRVGLVVQLILGVFYVGYLFLVENFDLRLFVFCFCVCGFFVFLVYLLVCADFWVSSIFYCLGVLLVFFGGVQFFYLFVQGFKCVGRGGNVYFFKKFSFLQLRQVCRGLR